MLSQKQNEALNSELAKFNIFSGVTGSGKSLITNLKVMKTLLEPSIKDGDLVLFSGNTSESLYDNVIKPIIQVDPVGLFTYSNKAGHQRLYFNSGKKKVEISCVGANNERAQDRVQGKNVALWLADEIVKQPKSFVEMALSRCRRVEGDRMTTTPVIWTCNPDHPEHFIKKDYIDNPEIEVKNWFFGFEDNPTINDDYIADVKRRYSGVFYQRMIEGKWVAAEGSIFTNFEPSFHIVNELPPMIDYFMGIDWGYNNPTAMVLFGIDKDNVYYAIDEWYQAGRLVDVAMVNELRQRGWDKLGPRKTPPSYVYADSEDPASCDAFRRFSNWVVVPASKPAGSVVDGIRIFQELLQKQGNGKARFYIHSKCSNLISQIGSYRWKTVRGVDKDEPVKENDHAVDAARYVIFSREAGRVRVIRKNPFR
jgi:PBSX family phage terminase large subunit